MDAESGVGETAAGRDPGRRIVLYVMRCVTMGVAK